MQQTIELYRITPAFLRWGIGIFGLGMAGIAAFELWRAVWPLSIVTPFFAIILCVGVSVSLTLVMGAIFGPDETWSIAPGRLTIHRSLRGVSTQLDYRPVNIVAISVETSDWDSRPPTYFLDIKLADGTQLKSPEIGTETKAQAARAMLQ